MVRLPALTWPVLALVLALLSIALSVYGWFRYRGFVEELAHTRSELASTTAYATELEGTLAQTTAALSDERNRNQKFADRISRISYTVSEIKRVQETDTELLQKYSRVYFLNEHYVPEELASIPDEYVYGEDKELEVLAAIAPRLERLLEEAKDDGLDLKVISAYRSFGTQAALKSSYRVTYGSGANRFSADQGYSEHQLGTTVDFTTSGVGATFTGFEGTPEYQWLKENAHKWGFVLSYPENNTHYQFEPWHWRYVGRNLAKELNERGIHFYDMDQREIDTYLGQFFD